MTTRRTHNQGPFLSAAFICEKVLEERNGVKSAIRIIDRVTRTVVSPNPPEEMEPFDWEGVLLIKLKSGRARGNHRLRIELHKPSGEKNVPIQQMLNFEGEEDRGIDVVAQMHINFDQTGIYWMFLYIEENMLTQIPLRVIYAPQARQIPYQGGSPPPPLEE